MLAVLLVVVPLTVYLFVNVFYIILRNYQAHQFFRLKSPQLPVLETSPNIFYGHIKEVTWRDKNWKVIDELHSKYGVSFGFYMCNQPWVSTKDLDLIKLIEVDKAHRHINRSKFGLPMREFNNSIFQLKDDDWRRIRRAISPALNNHKVRSEEVTADIRQVVNQLRDSLAKRASTSAGSFQIDVHDTFQRYTLAVIFLITYKKQNVIDFDAKQDAWVQSFELGKREVRNIVLLISLVFPFLRSTCNFLLDFHPIGMLQKKIIDYIIAATDLNRTAHEHHEKYQKRMSVTVENYKERSFSELKQSGNFKRRLVDTIIDSYLERKINHDEFIGSTLFLLLAGFETTAATLSCLIWNLMRQPEVQEKLRKAIREEGIDADYVQWCIMETVRWHPAVPLGTGRILGEDVTVNGLTYAKGSFIMPSTYSIHHDSSIWPEAEKFLPERWANVSQHQHPAAFMGFGLGPRNCVGGKLAVHEIKLVLEVLLKSYRLESCSETCETYDFSAPGLIYTNLDKPIKARLVALEEASL